MPAKELIDPNTLREQAFSNAIKGSMPSLLAKSHWFGKVMDWCMHPDDSQVQMFWFVDVFPKLHDPDALVHYLREHFGADDQTAPA